METLRPDVNPLEHVPENDIISKRLVCAEERIASLKKITGDEAGLERNSLNFAREILNPKVGQTDFTSLESHDEHYKHVIKDVGALLERGAKGEDVLEEIRAYLESEAVRDVQPIEQDENLPPRPEAKAGVPDTGNMARQLYHKIVSKMR